MRRLRPGCDELDALASGVLQVLRFGQSRESELHRSAEFLRFAQCAGGFGIFDLDLESGLIEATPLFFEIVGIPSHGMAFHRDDWLATVHGEDFEAVVHALSHAIASGLNFDAEYRIPTLDGGVRWVASRGEIARGTDGEPARLIGTITDVTVRKQLEESLKQKAESLSIAQAVAGIATMDLDIARGSAGSARKTSRAPRRAGSDSPRRLGGRLQEHSSRGPRTRPPRAARDYPREPHLSLCLPVCGSATGAERWIGEKADVAFGADGKALRITGALIDITQLKLAEARAHLHRKASRPHHARHARRRLGVRRRRRTVLVRAALRGAARIRQRRAGALAASASSA